MNVQIEMSAAQQLAAWTTLSLEAVEAIYSRTNNSVEARNWKQLEVDAVAEGGDIERALITAASNEAADHNFFVNFTKAILIEERVKRGDTGSEEIDRFVEELPAFAGSDGTMQALSNAAAGFFNRTLLRTLDQKCGAIGYVEDEDQRVIGTALLVGSDLVLTSAHVALAAQGNAFSNKLRPKMRFYFPPPENDQKKTPIEATAAAGSPEIFSNPDGTPPNNLKGTLDQASKQNLDFALVRLSHEIPGVEPLNILNPDVPKRGERCFIFGYPGGRALKFDIDDISDIQPDYARIMHLANAVPGMSGSCCIANDGGVIGLHEGGFQKIDSQGNRVFDHNRAISLKAIREVLKKQKPDPLMPRPKTPAFLLNDSSLVRDWYYTGARLAGSDLIKAWQRAVVDVLAAQPWTNESVPPLHPLFPRSDLEQWISHTLKASSDDRIAYVGGNPGSGKTFACVIVGTKVGERNLVVLKPTSTTAWTWEEALSKLSQSDTANARLRPEVGAIKHDDIPAIIAKLEKYGGVDRTTSSHPLFVSIDFGRPDSQRVLIGPWLQLIAALAGLSWVRLVLIGMTETEKDNVDAALSGKPETKDVGVKDIVFQSIGVTELVAFQANLAKDQGVKLKRDETRKKIEEYWNDQTALHARNPALSSAEAVLIALKLFQAIRSEAPV